MSELVMMMMMAVVMMSMSPQQVSGTDLLRTNVGVVLTDMGTLHSSASSWYHHFVVELPKLTDLLPDRCLRWEFLGKADKPHAPSTCQFYSNGTGNKISDLLVSLNKQVIEEFNLLKDTARRNLPRLPPISSFSRRRRAAPLQFIGDLSKSLFGTATQQDLEMVAKKVNSLIRRGTKLSEAMVQHERNFESYMATNNQRVNKLRNVVFENHVGILQNQKYVRRMFNETREYEYANTELIRRLNETEYLVRHLREVSENIRSMPRGEFPELLVSDRQIRQAAQKISAMVKKSNPDFTVLHRNPNYFYKHGSFVAHLSNETSVWVTLKFPVGLISRNSKVYRIQTHPVPVSHNSTHATRITDLPEYVVIRHTLDEQVKYAPLSQLQLNDCLHNGGYICKFGLKFYDLSINSCLSAVIRDNASLIHSACDFLFFRDQIESGFRPISKSALLFYDVNEVTLKCGEGKVYTEAGCKYCIFHVPCNCQITFKEQSYSLSADEGCSNVRAQISRKHLINLAVLKEFGVALRADIKASSYFDRLHSVKIPKIEFFDHEYKQFLASDNKTGLKLNKIAEAARNNKQVFETLSDPILMGQLDIPSGFDWKPMAIIIGIALAVLSIVCWYILYRKVNKFQQKEFKDMQVKLAQALITIDLLQKGADARFVTGVPAPNALTIKTSSQVTVSTASAVDVYFNFHDEKMDPVLQGILTILFLSAIGYMIYRYFFKRTCQSKTHVYLEIFGASFTQLLLVDSTIRNRDFLDIKEPFDGIRIRVGMMSAHIDWKDTHLVDNAGGITSKLLKSDVRFINPVSAYKLRQFVRNKSDERIRFRIYFKDETGFHLAFTYRDPIETQRPERKRTSRRDEYDSSIESTRLISPEAHKQVKKAPEKKHLWNCSMYSDRQRTGNVVYIPRAYGDESIDLSKHSTGSERKVKLKHPLPTYERGAEMAFVRDKGAYRHRQRNKPSIKGNRSAVSGGNTDVSQSMTGLSVFSDNSDLPSYVGTDHLKFVETTQL